MIDSVQIHAQKDLSTPNATAHAKAKDAASTFQTVLFPPGLEHRRSESSDELVRLHHSCEAMTPNSVVILNEVFNSTSLDDQVFLSTKILEKILAVDVIGVCVTFIDALSTLSEKTVSMVSTVDPEDPAHRTFQIVRKPADGLAYALSLAEKHGVTYAALCKRILT